ncbi:MAG: tetratricopeptide repeat protein [Tepidisphaeraceae bacterium]|jgi:tetratricopeptide repeat protein
MPDTDQQTLDYAIKLREAGHLDESRCILESLVAQRTRAHGRKEFDTQCAISQLGRTLRAMGRADEAAALHWEVLATRLEIYGRRSEFTINSAGILSETLRNSLHDHYMAAAVENWSAGPESPRETIGVGAPLTGDQLQQAIRDRQAAHSQNIARLVDEYLQRPSSERHRERSGIAR